MAISISRFLLQVYLRYVTITFELKDMGDSMLYITVYWWRLKLITQD
jgi:hypothetical protein